MLIILEFPITSGAANTAQNRESAAEPLYIIKKDQNKTYCSVRTPGHRW